LALIYHKELEQKISFDIVSEIESK